MPDRRWLILRLEAPLLAFGGVTVDQEGVTRDFPAASMLTGLLANALGFRRTEWEKLQALQDRLVFAARRERDGTLLTDTQNARLAKTDRGWTTWGRPEGRDGASYGAPHRRRRDYHGDACVTVALRLDSADSGAVVTGEAMRSRRRVPCYSTRSWIHGYATKVGTVCYPATLAASLDRPARPLFIGRKSCLPSLPLRQKDSVTAPTAHAALQRFPPEEASHQRLRAVWPLGEGPSSGEAVHRILDLPDLRNWRTGLHGGTRKVVEGDIAPERGAA